MHDRNDHKDCRDLKEDRSKCCHMVPNGNSR